MERMNLSFEKILKNRPRSGFEWALALRVVDGLAVAISLFLGMNFDGFGSMSRESIPPHLWILYGFVSIVLVDRFGGYDWPCWGSYRAIAGRIFLVILAGGGGFFILLRWGLGLEPAAFLPPLFLQVGTFLVLMALFRTLLPWMILDVFRIPAQEPLVFVGNTQRMQLLLRESSRKMGKTQLVVGYFGEKSVSHQNAGYVHLGSLGELEARLSTYQMARLVIDQTCLDQETLNRIAKECVLRGVIVRLIPDSIGFWVGRSHDRIISGLPVLVIANSSYHLGSHRFVKRATDIAGALVGLVVSTPIILLLALMIRVESKGPVWIRQKRAGLEGRSFWIYKLRSMRAGVEEDPQSWAANDDPRCTRLGKLIRRFSLDELPQFWCVLKGDMSLVGPRPEMAELVAQFCESVHSYGLRFRMKPGMTGWAAIHGFRGNTSLQERIDYDMYYIQNWSWQGDIRILIATLLCLKSDV
jgi:exopolysaccharide biosynthesis polyprenyl glycosylphosphotransferase